MIRLEVEALKKKRNGIHYGEIAKVLGVKKVEFQEWLRWEHVPQEHISAVEEFFELSYEELKKPIMIEIPVSFLISIINDGKESIDDYCNRGGEARDLIREIESNVDVAKGYVMELMEKLGIDKKRNG